jgi:hypothetical protein
MPTKSKAKSNNQKRGGKRPGAGRPTGSASLTLTDRRETGVDIALSGLDRALKAYDDGASEAWTPVQHRWHLAITLFGVPTATITAALFEPQVSKNVSRDIAAAIKAVEEHLA